MYLTSMVPSICQTDNLLSDVLYAHTIIVLLTGFHMVSHMGSLQGPIFIPVENLYIGTYVSTQMGNRKGT